MKDRTPVVMPIIIIIVVVIDIVVVIIRFVPTIGVTDIVDLHHQPRSQNFTTTNEDRNDEE